MIYFVIKAEIEKNFTNVIINFISIFNTMKKRIIIMKETEEAFCNQVIQTKKKEVNNGFLGTFSIKMSAL